MKMKEVKAYQCKYCKKLLLNKKYAKEHEAKCIKNTKYIRLCATCPEYTRKEAYELNKYAAKEKPYCISRECFLNPPRLQEVGKKSDYNFLIIKKNEYTKIVDIFEESEDNGIYEKKEVVEMPLFVCPYTETELCPDDYIDYGLNIDLEAEYKKEISNRDEK